MSTAAAIAFCLLGTRGNGNPLVYPLGRVSTETLTRINKCFHDRVAELKTREAERRVDEEVMHKHLHDTVKALNADIKELKEGTQGGRMGRGAAASIPATDYQALRDGQANDIGLGNYVTHIELARARAKYVDDARLTIALPRVPVVPARGTS